MSGSAKEIFGKAFEIESQTERAAWLDEACGENTELRSEVEELLAAFNEAGHFMVTRNNAVPSRELDSPAFPQRYEPVSEIARGGMGVVWRVIDKHFDRPLAVKVMLPNSAANAESRFRFEREAQLTGTLQHPAIPPVVDRGTLKDGMPFFSMKLVEGQTLAQLLDARPHLADDVSRFVVIFEQLCHAVGYAHSQRVIHRDLKPANVMVGSFGEVQLMDWGMAKRLEPTAQEPPAIEMTAESNVPAKSACVETVQYGDSAASDTDVGLTRGGTVMGTLAYMAPEQGRGEVDRLDSRTDVFGLGAILCEILTGERPYTGEDVWQQVFRADLQPAFDRLDACGADAELVGLCKQCLCAEAARRPVDGSSVAAAIGRYHQTVQQRLEQERVDRVAAQTRAVEEEKRGRVERVKRRATVLAAGFALLILIGCAAAGIWYQSDQADRRVAIAEREARQRAEREGREKGAGEDIDAALDRIPVLWNNFQFGAAEALLKQAESRLSTIAEPGMLATRVRQARADLNVVRKLDDIRLRKATWTSDGDREITFANGHEGAYAQAFRDYGIDIFGKESAERLGNRIAVSKVTQSLVAALDDWAYDDQGSRPRTLAIARAADRDRFLDRLRDPALWLDRTTLLELVQHTDLPSLSPAVIGSLALRLAAIGEHSTAADLWTRATMRHPSEFFLCFGAASALSRGPHSRPMEAIGHYRAAIAIRPRDGAAYTNLGGLLEKTGRLTEAEAAHRRSIEANPKSAPAHFNLGNLLQKTNRLKEAEAAYRRAIKAAPEFAPAHHNLGFTLYEIGRSIEAEAAYRRAIKADPQLAIAHLHLGLLLKDTGRLREAEAACRRAIKLDPRFAKAHYNLGNLLQKTNRLKEAEAAYRRAIKADPKLHQGHNNLGLLLYETGRLKEAEAAFRRAIEANPKDDEAHVSLGVLLLAAGRLKEAEAAYHRAINVNPKNAKAHNNLGALLGVSGRLKEAEAAYRRAIEANPKGAKAHCFLAFLLLLESDRFVEAVKLMKRGHALGIAQKNWRYPSAQWVAHAERLLAFDRKLPAIESGRDKPANFAEALALADFALVRKRRPRIAAKLFQTALGESTLSPQLRFRHQYNAACAALLCAAGKVETGTKAPDAVESGRLRNQALAWLNANLATWKRLLTMNSKARATGLKQLRHSFVDPDLASVRGDAIIRLPKDERDGWRKLWADVENVLRGEPVIAPRP